MPWIVRRQHKKEIMIVSENIRQGDRELALLNALRAINRIKFEEGGPTDKPPTLADYMEWGLKLATLSDQERESIKFMLEKLQEGQK